jgi:hypothetical protein
MFQLITSALPDKRPSTSSCLNTMLHRVIAHEDGTNWNKFHLATEDTSCQLVVGLVDVVCDHLADKRGIITADFEKLQTIIHGSRNSNLSVKQVGKSDIQLL